MISSRYSNLTADSKFATGTAVALKWIMEFKVAHIALLVMTMTLASCGNKMAFDSINDSASLPNTTCSLLDCPTIPPDEREVDTFQQGEQGSMVDILVVVDNSPSMAVEQRKLGSRFQSFISALDNVDWQMAFTTTDVSNGTYGLKGRLLDLNGRAGEKILNKTTPSANSVFQRTVRRSESNCSFNCPTSDEQGLLASIMAMEKSNGENRDFFRNDADLAIIYISDEDELSDGPSNATKAEDVVRTFQTLWQNSKTLQTYGVVIEPNDVNCLKTKRDEGSTAYYGRAVKALADLTKGLTGSICQNDYSQTLEQISRRVKEMADTFELKYLPEGPVSVELLPAQNVSFRVDGKKIIFSKAPQAGSTIHATYKRKK